MEFSHIWCHLDFHSIWQFKWWWHENDDDDDFDDDDDE